MPARVFLSHCSGDKALADDVTTMLQTSIGVSPGQIFYSSGSGTGVPGGHNFIQYIRDQMSGSTFVIALITPAFRESEFCLAELGAVWLTADDKDFFPLCVPTVERSSLQATLTGIQVERLDDRASLAGLLERICTHFGSEYNAAACDNAITVFMAGLPSRLSGLPQPQSVPMAALEALEAEKAALGDALSNTRDELADARRRFDELRAAQTPEERAAVVSPAGDVQARVHLLIAVASEAMERLDSAVVSAFPFALRGEPMPWPADGFGYEHDQIRQAVDDGFLMEDGDGVTPETKWPHIAAAMAAVRELDECLRELDSDEEEWFIDEYGVPPELRQGAAFDRLVG